MFILVMLVKERTGSYNGELLDLRNDYVFKAFFGDKRNTNLLLRFINSIVKEEIHSVELMDPHIERNHLEDKKSIMDVRVRTNSGEQINIEMQMEGHKAFLERMYLYMAKMYVSQDRVAKKYMDYKRAIQIIVTDFNLLQEVDYHNVYKITNQKSGIIFTTHYETHILELPKLKLENKKKSTELEKWLLFLKSNKRIKEELAMESSIMEEAYKEIKRLSQNPETQRLAEFRERELKDIMQREYDAREDGVEQGKKDIVLNMIRKDFSPEQIKDITGVSLDKIKRIIASIS